jgi:hypothetical protein
MADKKITQLPSLSFISGSNTGYYAGEVVLPIVHNSTTVKMEAQKFALYATQWSATTASNTFIGNQTVNGNVIVTGKITAEEFFTEITSASIIFQSGSTLFGNSSDDIHTFTGTININGKVVGNAPLDFTSQSLNIATGSYNRLYAVTSSVHFTTASLNTQTGSQQLINVQNSIVTSSLNLATSSLNFTTGALNIASGSYNRFYQSTASIQLTTASLNQATSSLNFASGALEIATGSYNRFYDMTSSVHFTTQSLNVQTGSQNTINFNISKVTASIDAHILGISIYTASLISQTNTISTFTSSVNFATSSLNTQTGSQDLVNRGISSVTGSINAQSSSQDLVNRRISSVTGSMNTQSSSQDSVNYQNSIVTSSFRNEIGGIEAYTASLKSAIVVNGSSVRIIGELSASRIYTEYITSSVLFVTGSNIIGDQSTDKHEFTGSVNIADTLFIKGQAIGLGELNSFSGSQINKDFTLSKVTASIDAHILGVSKQTGSQDLVNLAISTFTGSLRTELNNIEALTASMKAASIVSSSTQVQNYDVFALNSNLYNSTGSLIGITNGLMALTASMKAAAIVSSSQQVQNYFTFAKTGSANTFYGTQTISGDIKAISNTNSTLKSVQLGTAVNGTGGGNRVFDGSFTGTTTSFIGVDASDQGYGYFPATIVSGNTYTLFFKSVETNCTLGTIITSTGTNFATSTIQTLTLPSVTNGVYNTVTFTASASATHIGFAGYPTAGTITLTISEVSLVEGTADTNIGKLIVQRSLVANGDSMFNGNVTASGNLLVSTGNLVMGTAGGGIDFSATSNSSGTMTSELLNDYEEGTWTPTNTNVSTATGVYTKIGRLVTVQARVVWNGAGTISLNGLPFTTSATVYAGSIMYSNLDLPVNTIQLVVINDISSTYITGYTIYDDASSIANPVTKNGTEVNITLQYSV